MSPLSQRQMFMCPAQPPTKPPPPQFIFPHSLCSRGQALTNEDFPPSSQTSGPTPRSVGNLCPTSHSSTGNSFPLHKPCSLELEQSYFLLYSFFQAISPSCLIVKQANSFEVTLPNFIMTHSWLLLALVISS